MSARIEFESAARYSLRQLAVFFNTAYEGYAHPVATTPELLARRVREESLDLATSAVMELDGAPVGIFFVGRRDDVAWCGGFGIFQPQRGRGLSAPLAKEMITRSRASGAVTLQLEVLKPNTVARHAYERAGFQTVRDLVVYSSHEATPDASVLARIRRVDTARHFAALNAEQQPPACWQRSVASLHVRTGIEAYEGEDGRSGVLISRMPDGTARVMSLRGPADDALVALLRNITASVTRLLAINEPAESVYHDALRAAGLVETTRQDEMRLSLA